MCCLPVSLQASDATLTKEELEEREAARLAALEAARLKRMRADAAAAAAGDDGDADDFADDNAAAAAAELPKGGYAAKRARANLEAEQEERRQRRKLDLSGVFQQYVQHCCGTDAFPTLWPWLVAPEETSSLPSVVCTLLCHGH